MKIYTYYEELPAGAAGTPGEYFKRQEELIELWKYSWKKQGFDPVVLGPQDAEKYPNYDKLMVNIKKYHKKITGANIENDYELACFKRWFAYATCPGYYLTSDYDIINFSFKPYNENNNIEEPLVKIDEHGNIIDINQLTFFGAMCPCLNAGYQEQYIKMAEGFSSITRDRLKDIIAIYTDKEKKQSCGLHPSGGYHDQDFFVVNFGSIEANPNSEKLQQEYKIGFRHFTGWEHYSKHYIWSYLLEKPEYKDIDWQDIRIMEIRKCLEPS